MKIRNYSEEQAIENDMDREDDLGQPTTHCPECGCPWFGNKDLCGPGHRVCCDCYQDWYVGISYKKMAPLRELPAFENVWCFNCGEDFGPGDSGFSHCESHKGL